MQLVYMKNSPYIISMILHYITLQEALQEMSVTYYFRVSVLQRNYSFNYSEILINVQYLLYD